ncbi:MAG: chain-length determining protein [Alphaproteobacteria bacterium]|nr:MAG: chain-length determining protein [Alphaproteobacteria bacterium]
MDGLYEQLKIALHQVWRRRWLALAVAWALCLVGWLAIALIPNSYESKARVYVQLQSILPAQIGINPAGRQNDLQRVKQTLTASERDLAAQVAKLREAIKVTAQQDNLFEISATSSISGFSNKQNSRTATAVVQNLIDLFVEDNLAGDRDEATQSLTFLDQELRRREQALQEAEQRRVEFEQKFMGLMPGEGSIEQRMSNARNQMATVDQQLMEAQSALASLRGQLNSTPPTLEIPGVSGPGVAGPASAQISILQAQLAQAAARGWTDQHPDVLATKAQIERLRPAAAQERASGGGRATGTPNPSYVSLRSMVAEKEAQAAGAQMRKAQIQNDLNRLTAGQTSEPGLMAQQAQLNRDYDVLKRQYDKLLENREQVRLQNDVNNKTNAIQFKVIDPPSSPVVPTAPNRPLLLTAILIVAIGAGIAAAFVRGQLQTTFPTQNRLAAATGLPVLGAISEVLTDARKRDERKKLVWLGGGAGALAAGYALLMLVEFWQRSTVA